MRASGPTQHAPQPPRGGPFKALARSRGFFIRYVGAQRNQIGSERALASVSSGWSEAIGRVAQGRRRGSLASLFP
jgi:hypothetical protein